MLSSATGIATKVLDFARKTHSSKNCQYQNHQDTTQGSESSTSH